MSEKILVISAHIGDFVWRSGGTIAKYVNKGAEVKVIALTMGARGESNSYWKKDNPNMEECIAIRKKEAENAAKLLGINQLEFLYYEDFPLVLNSERIKNMAEKIVSFKPDFILTHDKGVDRVNPDHYKTSIGTLSAVYLAAKQIGNIPVFGFEPMTPEICSYSPDILIDITNEFETKYKAMECLETQSGSIDNYVQKAILRGGHCAGRGGKKDCKYAESFSLFQPVIKHNDFVF